MYRNDYKYLKHYRYANKNNSAMKKLSIGDMARNIVKYSNRVKDNPRNAEMLERTYNRAATFLAMFALFSAPTVIGGLIFLFASIVVGSKARDIRSVKEYQQFKEVYNIILANKNIPKAVKESEMMQAWDEVLEIIEGLSYKDDRLRQRDVDILKENLAFIKEELDDMKYIHRDLRKAGQMLQQIQKRYNIKR